MDLEQLKKDTKEISGRCFWQKAVSIRTDSSSRDVFMKLQEANWKASNIDIAEAIVQALLDELNPGIYLAVQGCEHLSRLGGRANWQTKELEIVNVLPRKSPCRGAGQLAASSISRILLK